MPGDGQDKIFIITDKLAIVLQSPINNRLVVAAFCQHGVYYRQQKEQAQQNGNCQKNDYFSKRVLAGFEYEYQ